MEYDVIIVGAGAAGCVLANRLSEDPHVRVCLIEAGPKDTSPLVQCPAGFALLARMGGINWGFETLPQAGLNGRRGYQPRGKVVGGSTSVNAMVYLRGQAQDYERWAAEGNAGWGWPDVLPYFLRAENNERQFAGANAALHGKGGPLNVADLLTPNVHSRAFVQAAVQAGLPHNDDFNGVQQEGAGLYQVMQKRGERASVAKGYLTPLLPLGPKPRANLQVITGGRVLQVLIASESKANANAAPAEAGQAKRAIGVKLLQGGHTHSLIAKREVVLSAGALQTPQLLQVSGVGDAAHLQGYGIAVQHHLPGVGEHLHDHVDAVLLGHVPSSAPGAHGFFGLSPKGSWHVLQGVRQWVRERKGLLTTNYAEAGAFFRSDDGQARPDIQLHFVIGKLVDHGRKLAFGHGWSCHVCLLQPQSRGRVNLASADPLAAPAIDPGFFQHPDDLPKLVKGFKTARRIMNQPALASLRSQESAASAKAQSDEQIADFLRNHADSIYHPVGSCRMGPDPRRDVVDARLRVHGIAGLRVVDASVMPHISSGNTTAPVVMIAEKAADLMKADWAA